MKILKEDSPPMIALNKAEEILREAGIQLDVQSNIIFMTLKDGASFRLRDIEGSEYSTNFPRNFESERFVKDE